MVRVIDYRLEGIVDAEPLYRLVTTLLDPVAAPALELAALYHERWESESTFAELKVTVARGAPDAALARGRSRRAGALWPAARAFRAAAADARGQSGAGCDPDQLSFVHAVRIVRRHLPFHAAFSPSAAPAHG